MPSNNSPRSKSRSGPRRPPNRPLERKWRSYLNAHALAFGVVPDSIQQSKRNEIKEKLFRLVRTRGARDYLNNTHSKNATAYIRIVTHLFDGKRELADQYLANLKEGFQ